MIFDEIETSTKKFNVYTKDNKNFSNSFELMTENEQPLLARKCEIKLEERVIYEDPIDKHTDFIRIGNSIFTKARRMIRVIKHTTIY